MIRAVVFALCMAASQPVVATVVVDMVPAAAAAQPVDAAKASLRNGKSESRKISAGPLTAGFAIFVMLGWVIGRRKSSLPEVVS